jgi:hypothetical protein
MPKQKYPIVTVNKNSHRVEVSYPNGSYNTSSTVDSMILAKLLEEMEKQTKILEEISRVMVRPGII